MNALSVNSEVKIRRAATRALYLISKAASVGASGGGHPSCLDHLCTLIQNIHFVQFLFNITSEASYAPKIQNRITVLAILGVNFVGFWNFWKNLRIWIIVLWINSSKLLFFHSICPGRPIGVGCGGHNLW